MGLHTLGTIQEQLQKTPEVTSHQALAILETLGFKVGGATANEISKRFTANNRQTEEVRRLRAELAQARALLAKVPKTGTGGIFKLLKRKPKRERKPRKPRKQKAKKAQKDESQSTRPGPFLL